MTIKAIQTIYNGYKFRSRLEARWAVFFDEVGVEYEYECQGFDLGDGGWYLPDFYLPQLETWVEIKPDIGDKTEHRRVYLAGKVVNDGGWRNNIKLLGVPVCSPDEEKAHNAGLHYACSSGRTKQDILDQCLYGISGSSVLFAWIDRLDTFGTFAEIGFAKALGKEVWIAIDEKLWPQIQYVSEKEYQDYQKWLHIPTEDADPENDEDDAFYRISWDVERFESAGHELWFLVEMADHSGFFSSADQAFLQWANCGDDKADKKMRKLAEGTKQQCWIIRGNPYPEEYRVTAHFAQDKLANLQFGTGKTALYTLAREHVVNSAWLQRAFERARQARFEHGETP